MNLTTISLLSGLGGMFGWGLYDFFAGIYAKKIGSFRTLFWSQLSGCFFIILCIPFFPMDLHIPVLAMILLPIASLFYSAGYLFFMKGFEIGNISIVAAIMNLWAVFTMLIAFLFMGQRLSLLQSVGAFMVLAGAIITSLNWSDIRNRNFGLSSGVKETVIGAFFFGSFWNISEFISEKIGWLPATIYIKSGIILILLLFSLALKRNIYIGKTRTKTKVLIVLMGILETGAITIVNFGLTVGDAILITPIASALSVVTILMAVIFLKDKLHKLQILGIISAVSGIILTGI